MTADEIDHAAAVVLDLIKVGADFYPPLAYAAPILSSYVRAEAARLIPLAKCGLTGDGTDYEFDYRQTFTLMRAKKA